MKIKSERVSAPFLFKMALACQVVATVYRQENYLFGQAAADRQIRRIESSGHNANKPFILAHENYFDPEYIVYELTDLADEEITEEERQAELTVELLGRVYAVLTKAERLIHTDKVQSTMDQYDTISDCAGQMARKLGIDFTYHKED